MLSLIVCISLLCSICVLSPAFVYAENQKADCFNKQFTTDDWTGVTSYGSGSSAYDTITSAGLFSVVKSNSVTPYIVSKSNYDLGSDFEVSVTSDINNQNLYDYTYSAFGIGDFSFIVRSYKVDGTPTNRYYILYKHPDGLYDTLKSCSGSSAIAFSNLADYIVASSDDISPDGYAYKQTVKCKVTFAGGVLSFYANDELVASVTAETVSAKDSKFTAFDFNDIKISFRLYHSWKVSNDGAYFKDLVVSRSVDTDYVISLISAIPQTVTASDTDAVSFARYCYNCLSDTDKSAVTNAAVLDAAEISVVIACIDELPDAVSSQDGDRISKCTELYNALTDTQKESITNYDVLTRAVGEFSVIDIIEDIDKIKTTTVETVYDYNALMKKCAALPSDKLAYVRNYSALVAVGTELDGIKSKLSAESIAADIGALKRVTFTPNNASAYKKQIQNIDLDYVADMDYIRAEICLYGRHDNIVGYNWFFEKEQELLKAMLAFNDLAESKLRIAYYKYSDGVELGKYCSFKDTRPVYAGDDVHFMGFIEANGYTPVGNKFTNLYNIYYTHNGTTSAGYQPVNGECLLRNLEPGTYSVYHNTYSSSDPAYLLFTFEVVDKPVYNYDLFDVATRLDHTVSCYSSVKYADKTDVAELWSAYDSLDMFEIDSVHSVRNLVSADRYVEDVEDGIIEDNSSLISNYGDLDGDNVVTASDLLIMRQYVLELNTLTQDQLKIANTDKSDDGNVTSADYLVVKQYLIGVFRSIA